MVCMEELPIIQLQKLHSLIINWWRILTKYKSLTKIIEITKKMITYKKIIVQAQSTNERVCIHLPIYTVWGSLKTQQPTIYIRCNCQPLNLNRDNNKKFTVSVTNYYSKILKTVFCNKIAFLLL